MPALSFDLNSIDWNLTLLLGRTILLVCCFAWAAIVFAGWRRGAERGDAQLSAQMNRLEIRLAELDARAAAAHAALAELGERVALLNTTAAAKGSARSYDIAIRMARSGAAREDLMASCGLTRQEAELVQRLHTPSQQQRLAAVG